MTFHCLTRGDLTLFEGFCCVFGCLFCLCFGFFCVCVVFLVWASPHDFEII